MSTIREEVVATMGIDSSSVESQLGIGQSYVQKWVGTVKGEEEKYTDWWNTELKKREESEIASSVRAASRSIQARKLLRERETARSVASQAEQAAANTVMGGGSMPEGWAREAELKKAARELEAKAAQAAEKGAAEGMRSGVMRESMVIMREGLRGNFTQMFGSATRLLGMLGMGAAELTGVGLVMGEVIGIAKTWWDMRKAEKQEAQSEERLDKSTGTIAERLRGQLKNFEKSGKVSHEEAAQMANRLNAPSATGNRMVQDFIRKHGGIVTNEQLKEMARLDEEHQKKMTENGREQMSLHARATADGFRELVLKGEMAKLDQHSVEYKKKQIELDEVQRDIQQDKKAVAEQQAEIDRKNSEDQRVRQEAQLRLDDLQQHEREKFMPTLEELAKHGHFGHEARTIARLDRRIKRDFERGDIKGADADIAARNKTYDSLADRGVVAERAERREVRDLTAKMEMHLDNIAAGKSAILVKPYLT